MERFYKGAFEILLTLAMLSVIYMAYRNTTYNLTPVILCVENVKGEMRCNYIVK